MNQEIHNSGGISHDMIARRAYALWEERGRPHGFDVQNWCDAERGLMEEWRELRQHHTERLQHINQLLHQDND